MNDHEFALRLESARIEAQRRSNGQATERDCSCCGGAGVFHHRAMKSPTGEITCDPCCGCGGYGLEFRIRNTTPALVVCNLLGELRPSCAARPPRLAEVPIIAP